MGKRTFDLFFSFIGLFFLFPFFILIIIGIKLTSPGPVFFRQTRIGKEENPFTILKFRTMVVDAEKKGPQITIGDRDPRITNLGHFLRKRKLDELPQLINVFLGDMSLVGPRPEVPHYVGYYTPEQKRVFSLRPGVTDYASIQFRDESELLKKYKDPEKAYIESIMPEKLKLNLEYLDKRDLFLDFKLILQTLKVL
jgi:lipopolysaccharide/colanic/teichoic acid biosynthesis glycosyltransferase